MQLILLEIGEKCELRDGRIVEILFIGEVHFTKGELIGVRVIEGGKGKHDGEYDNKRYFQCKPGEGVFIRRDKIRRKFRKKTNVSKIQSESAPQLPTRKRHSLATTRKRHSAKPEQKRRSLAVNRKRQSNVQNVDTPTKKIKHTRSRSLGPRDSAFKKDPSFKPYVAKIDETPPNSKRSSVKKDPTLQSQKKKGPRDFRRDPSWRPYRPSSSQTKRKSETPLKRHRPQRKRALGPREISISKGYRPYVPPPSTPRTKEREKLERKLGPRDIRGDPSFNRYDLSRDEREAALLEARRRGKPVPEEDLTPKRHIRSRSVRDPSFLRPSSKRSFSKENLEPPKRTPRHKRAKSAPKPSARRRPRMKREDEKRSPRVRNRTLRTSKRAIERKSRKRIKQNLETKSTKRGTKGKSAAPKPRIVKRARRRRVDSLRSDSEKEKSPSPLPAMLFSKAKSPQAKERVPYEQEKENAEESEEEVESEGSISLESFESSEDYPSFYSEFEPTVEFHPLPTPHVTNVRGKTPLEIMSESSEGSKLPIRTSEGLMVPEEKRIEVKKPEEVQATMNELGLVISNLGETIAQTELVVERVDVEVFGRSQDEEMKSAESDQELPDCVLSDEHLSEAFESLETNGPDSLDSINGSLDNALGAFLPDSNRSFGFTPPAHDSDVDYSEDADTIELKKEDDSDIHSKALEPLNIPIEEQEEVEESDQTTEEPSDTDEEVAMIEEEHVDLDAKECLIEEDAPEESDEEEEDQEEDAPEVSDLEENIDSDEYARLVEEEMKSLKSIDMGDSQAEIVAVEESNSLNEMDVQETQTSIEEDEKSLDPVSESEAQIFKSDQIFVNLSSETNLDDFCTDSPVLVDMQSESNLDDFVDEPAKKESVQEDLSFKRITIQHMNKGVCIMVEVNPKTTVYQVKRQIWQSNSILVVGQVLSYRKRVLGNSELIGDTGILKKNRAMKLEVKTIQNIENWNVSDVCAWCSVHPHLAKLASRFNEHEIDGKKLVALDKEQLKTLNFNDENVNLLLKEIPLLKQCFLVNERQREREQTAIISLQEAVLSAYAQETAVISAVDRPVKMSRKKQPSLKDWNAKRTVKFLNQKKRLKKYANLWVSHDVTGERFIELSEEDLEKMGITSAPDRKAILHLAAKARKSSKVTSPRGSDKHISQEVFLSASEIAI